MLTTHLLLVLSVLLLPASLGRPTPPRPASRPDRRDGRERDIFDNSWFACPDSSNTQTFYKIERWGLKRECFCPGQYQFYNSFTRQCHCAEPFTPSYSLSNELQCSAHQPPLLDDSQAPEAALVFESSPVEDQNLAIPQHDAPTPSPVLKRPVAGAVVGKGRLFGGTRGGGRGSMRETSGWRVEGGAEEMDEDVREMAGKTVCDFGEKLCKVGGGYSCLDVMNGLSSCGGCPGEQGTVDCTSLSGVSEVQCHAGTCQVDSCRSGYQLEYDPYPDAPSTSSCVSTSNRSKMPWFSDVKQAL
ncbi:hypothetical protein L198_02395 [Cryptococcus wingfieldii CBS 7118]|uniref:Protein CPL1-like domain-containing protein n=1 Tax=Cryptococcus wingfieldii CBS 7118 TaxID=1295528 RepID=A0A1E3JTV0_9TREE|nr:hypothetical protein L198_02395 [Cryptococcus wingfieldii CBS 7118]ODO03547.1 hypothetical protein L198_02395 [Cryptococcus wingfieldii CBS 7118]